MIKTDRTGGDQKSNHQLFQFDRKELKKRETSDLVRYGVIGMVLCGWMVVDSAFASGAILGFIGLMYCGYRFARAAVRLWSARNDAIALTEKGVYIPAVLCGWSSVYLKWQDLSLVNMIKTPRGGLLFLADGREICRLDSLSLGSWARLELLAQTIYTVGTREPGRRERYLRESERFQYSQMQYSRPLRLTHALLFILALCFGIQLVYGATQWADVLGGDQLKLIELGANVPGLSLNGQFDRLFTSTLLHGGWAHLIGNGVGLFFMGMVVECSLGWLRTAVVYLTSGILASIASTLLSGAPVSLGASGAIFGLLGAFFFLQIARPIVLPYSFQQRGRAMRWWRLILIANIGIPIFVPIIDWVAHLAGFVAGAGTAAILVWGQGKNREGIPFWIQGWAMVLIGTFAAALVSRMTHLKTGDDVRAELFAHVGTDSLRERAFMNLIAWDLAVEGAPDPSLLALAEKRMLEVVAHDRDPSLLDTLATLQHRRGRHAEAVSLEVEAAEAVIGTSSHDPRGPLFASQLLRFGVSQYEESGTPAVMLIERRKMSRLPSRVMSPQEPTIYYIGIFDGASPKSILRVHSSQVSGGEIRAPLLQSQSDCGVVLASTPAGTDEEPGDPLYWAYDPKVERLPKVWAVWPGRFELPKRVLAACESVPDPVLDGNVLPPPTAEDKEEPAGTDEPIGGTPNPDAEKSEAKPVGEVPAQQDTDQ